MPLIAYEQTEPDRTVFNVVWGHMQYPEHADRAFEYFVRLELMSMGLNHTENLAPVSMPAAWVKALAFGPSFAELKRGGAIRTRKGFTAGALLWAAYLYSHTGRRVTLNGAIEVLTRAVERGQATTLPVRPYGNKPEMHKAWKAMQPVAHLWAALTVIEAAQSNGSVSPSPAAAHRMLQLASGFLQWATSDDGGQLLSQSAAWHLPSFVESVPPQRVGRDMLPQFVIEAAQPKSRR